jgi:hypothetical protein
MGDPRFSIPVDELIARVRVPVAEQVEVHTEAMPPAPDWSAGLVPCADGTSGDGDGD